jgi:uncharacterized Fe-S cluster protein YjdI
MLGIIWFYKEQISSANRTVFCVRINYEIMNISTQPWMDPPTRSRVAAMTVVGSDQV